MTLWRFPVIFLVFSKSDLKYTAVNFTEDSMHKQKNQNVSLIIFVTNIYFQTWHTFIYLFFIFLQICRRASEHVFLIITPLLFARKVEITSLILVIFPYKYLDLSCCFLSHAEWWHAYWSVLCSDLSSHTHTHTEQLSLPKYGQQVLGWSSSSCWAVPICEISFLLSVKPHSSLLSTCPRLRQDNKVLFSSLLRANARKHGGHQEENADAEAG